ncbi:hypothetical protein Tco_1414740, partial [Tanacetum coccineum]
LRFKEYIRNYDSVKAILEKTDTYMEFKCWLVNGKLSPLIRANRSKWNCITANFGEASLQTNVNGIEHEKLSSSSSLTSSLWTDLTLKMKEVGPEGEKQSKEAKDEDVHVLKHESNFDSICYFFSIKYKDVNLAKQVEWLSVRG